MDLSQRCVTQSGGPIVPATVDERDGPSALPPDPVMVVCAHGKLADGASRARFKGGAHTKDARYKTKLCTDWGSTGACGRGARCDFAHGPIELRVPPTKGDGGRLTLGLGVGAGVRGEE